MTSNNVNKYCHKCMVDREGTHCNVCGSLLLQHPKCLKCETVVKISDIYCKNCGALLKPEAVKPKQPKGGAAGLHGSGIHVDTDGTAYTKKDVENADKNRSYISCDDIEYINPQSMHDIDQYKIDTDQFRV